MRKFEDSDKSKKTLASMIVSRKKNGNEIKKSVKADKNIPDDKETTVAKTEDGTLLSIK